MVRRPSPAAAVHHHTEPEQASDDGNPPVVTIVLPCFNEREHVIAEVERICAAMDDSGLTYELLAIDDASTDDTLTLLLEARWPLPVDADHAVPPQRRLRHGPADRHPRGPR